MSKKPLNPFAGDPEAVVIGAGKAGPKQPSAATGRYIQCLGALLIPGHPMIFSQVFQGQKCLFARCPISGCRAQYLFHGPDWKRIGVSRDEAYRLAPNAIFG